MKTIFKNLFVLICLSIFSIAAYAQNSEMIFEFERGNAGLFNKDDDNNLFATILITNANIENFNELEKSFKSDKGVLEFEITQNQKNQTEASIKFKKADLNYFYDLFRRNGVSAIKVDGKTTKIEYLELKTDEIVEPTTFANASDPSQLEYYDKRITDAEFKINWVQHDRNEIKKAILNGWFEEAEKTLKQLKEERENFIKKNEKK